MADWTGATTLYFLMAFAAEGAKASGSRASPEAVSGEEFGSEFADALFDFRFEEDGSEGEHQIKNNI
jgi:hypothetical protein